MRITILSLTFSTFLSSSAYCAGIPVFDAVSNQESLQQWLQKLQQWQETVSHFKSELNAYQQQLATATGVRDIQVLLQDAKSLKNDIAELGKHGISLDALLTNPQGSYSHELDNLYKKYQFFATCPSNHAAPVYLQSCKQLLLNQAVAIENTHDIQNKMSQSLDIISTLSDRISLSKDSKESQDLANAVAAKSVQLHALTTQWEISVKQSEQRAALLIQQRQKAYNDWQLYAPVADFNH